MDLDLLGKNAFVCGSSQGIGKAVAIELSKLGANVTLSSRDEANLQNAISELNNSKGQQHEYLIADMLDPQRLREELDNHIKEKRSYHILINNTGGPIAGTAFNSKIIDYANAFTSHLLSAQVMAQAIVPFMKLEAYGRIINITSISAKQPIKELGISNTIRASVCNWGKSLSNELAEFGITVNNVLPGYTNTNRLKELIDNKANIAGVPPDQMRRKLEREVPLNRIADPSEIANAVAFLASPAAGYINGINLPVDGGRTKSL